MGAQSSQMHVGSKGWPMWSHPTGEPLWLKSPKKKVLIESCQNTQCITVSCLWVCMTTGQSRCPCWPLFTAESTNNGRNRTTAQWNKVIWSDQANFLLHQIAALPCLPGEHLAPWCTMGRRQAIRKSQRSRDGVLNGSGVYCYWEKE